jgi:hypothetical protein
MLQIIQNINSVSKLMNDKTNSLEEQNELRNIFLFWVRRYNSLMEQLPKNYSK